MTVQIEYESKCEYVDMLLRRVAACTNPPIDSDFPDLYPEAHRIVLGGIRESLPNLDLRQQTLLSLLVASVQLEAINRELDFAQP